MLLAQVVGNVWGAKQAEGLRGYRLLVCRPLTARAARGARTSGKGENGVSGEVGGDVVVSADSPLLETSRRTVVAVDRLGAGPGELVLVAHGTRCRDLTLGEQVPTKEVVVAIVDRASLETSGEAQAGASGMGEGQR